MHAKSLQSCLTLWVPMDCSPPGSSVHGILQARILEGAAMLSSRGCPLPRDGTVSPALWADSLLLNHCGSPFPPRGPRKQQGRGGLLQERELSVNSPIPHAHNVVCLQTCWFCFQSLSWVALSSPLQVICQVQAPRCPVQSACPARRQLQGPLWTRTRQSPSWDLRDGGQVLTRDDSPSHPHHSSPVRPTRSSCPWDRISHPQWSKPGLSCLSDSRIPALLLLSHKPALLVGALEVCGPG